MGVFAGPATDVERAAERRSAVDLDLVEQGVELVLALLSGAFPWSQAEAGTRASKLRP